MRVRAAALLALLVLAGCARPEGEPSPGVAPPLTPTSTPSPPLSSTMCARLSLDAAPRAFHAGTRLRIDLGVESCGDEPLALPPDGCGILVALGEGAEWLLSAQEVAHDAAPEGGCESVPGPLAPGTSWELTRHWAGLVESGDARRPAAPGAWTLEARAGGSVERLEVTVLPPAVTGTEGLNDTFRTLARDTLSGVEDPTRLVLKDDAAWAAFWEEHASAEFPPPERPHVDFARERVVAVALGRRATCDEVEILRLETQTEEGVTLVHLEERTASAADACGPFGSTAVHVAAIARAPTRIEFREG